MILNFFQTLQCFKSLILNKKKIRLSTLKTNDLSKNKQINVINSFRIPSSRMVLGYTSITPIK